MKYQEHYINEEYRQWEGSWELINGAPYPMIASQTVTHQCIVSNITYELHQQALECNNCLVLNETEYEISEDTVVRPDVLMICRPIGERIDKTPEIIFEVLSPTTSRRDEIIKFELYAQAGVLYYVLVNPRNRLAKVYRRHEEGRYVKQDDCETETYRFDFGKCHFDFDFSAIWRE